MEETKREKLKQGKDEKMMKKQIKKEKSIIQGCHINNRSILNCRNYSYSTCGYNNCSFTISRSSNLISKWR